MAQTEGIKMEIYECNLCENGTCYSNNKHLYCNKGIAKWTVAEGYSLYKAPVKKEPELMTFFEAWVLANDGDKVMDKYGNFLFKGGTDCSFSISSLVKKTWKIIPEDPKVLNSMQAYANRYIHKAKTEDEENIHFCYYDSGYSDGDKNGQLKERKRLQPLIEAAQNSIMGGRIEEKALEDILLNLELQNKDD